jgi:hypothetical protein
VTVPVSFLMIGLTRFSQYNTPYESQCATPQQNAVVITMGSPPGGFCYFNPVVLGSTFAAQVTTNGTGVSNSNGILKAYKAGAMGVCQLLPGMIFSSTFFSVDIGGNPITTITGTGNKVLSDGTGSINSNNKNNPPPGSLATDPGATAPRNGSTFLYGDEILLIDQNNNNESRGIRSVQDLCPACSGGFGGLTWPNTVAHIDMYNGTSQSCSVHNVPDYGNFYAIRLR